MEEGGHVALRCNCGFTFIDPAPGKDDVEPTLDPHHRFYYLKPAKVRVAWVKKIKSHGLLLDVGCGNGEFAEAAIREGFDVEGMEPLETRAQTAESKLGIKVSRSLIEDDVLPENTYDIVFHVDLLSHFPDPVKSLESMRRLIKDDGVVCFEVGLHEKLSPFWTRFIGRGNMPAHRWFYDRESVKQLLSLAGLEVISIQTFDIGLSNILSTLLLSLFRPDVKSGQKGMTVSPMTGGVKAKFYYSFHMWLRYSLGRWFPFNGPKTALVAAIVKTE